MVTVTESFKITASGYKIKIDVETEDTERIICINDLLQERINLELPLVNRDKEFLRIIVDLLFPIFGLDLERIRVYEISDLESSKYYEWKNKER